jgi:hypothetical protein
VAHDALVMKQGESPPCLPIRDSSLAREMRTIPTRFRALLTTDSPRPSWHVRAVLQGDNRSADGGACSFDGGRVVILLPDRFLGCGWVCVRTDPLTVRTTARRRTQGRFGHLPAEEEAPPKAGLP